MIIGVRSGFVAGAKGAAPSAAARLAGREARRAQGLGFRV